MSCTIIKGGILSAPTLGELKIIENGYLVAREGVIVDTYEKLPEEYTGCPVDDYGDALVLQGFSDMHLHGPQYPMIGLGLDKELLGWLNTYTWPTEARFADEDYAREIYRRLAAELVQNGTTRVCMFSSLHENATLILMEELEKAGITGCVGKVNMDRNGAESLQETTEGSMAATESWLARCDRFEHIRPILTPRFSPSCTEPLMAWLGKLAKKKDLPIQSHLSESQGEIAWVRELFPDCDSYWKTYDKHGLWTNQTLMAHCVWSDDQELESMKATGVTAVHCPDSNMDLRSGIAPVRRMLDMGVSVVLGSDIAGGGVLNVFDILRSAVQVSKLRQVAEGDRHLTPEEGWYLATSAANLWFGEKPGFAPGNRLSVMVLRDDDLPAPEALEARQRFQRLLYRRQPHALAAVYSGTRRLL